MSSRLNGTLVKNGYSLESHNTGVFVFLENKLK